MKESMTKQKRVHRYKAEVTNELQSERMTYYQKQARHEHKVIVGREGVHPFTLRPVLHQ